MAFLPPLPDEPVAAPHTWGDTWKMAVTRPSIDTFVLLAHAPGVSSRTAHLWIFFSALVGSILAGSLGATIGTLLGSPSGAGPSPLDLLLFAPLVSLFMLALFIIGVGSALICAHALGGKGIYPRLAHVAAAFTSPLLIVGSIISALPVVNGTNLLVVLYGAWLSLLAVQAITRLPWHRALLALVLTLGALLLLLGLFLLAALPLLVNMFPGAPR